MDAEPNIALVCALLADPSRVRMAEALVAAHPLTATDLAARAGVSSSTASSHLAKLVRGGLFTVNRCGRQNLYDLAGPEVVCALEALSTIAPPMPAYTENQRSRARAVREARTCYDHLAGKLGVALFDAWCDASLLTLHAGNVDITRKGEAAFTELGIAIDALRGGRRPLARACIDWSERCPHLAGALGAAFATRAFALGWLTRVRGTRAVRVTDRGRAAIRGAFDLAV